MGMFIARFYVLFGFPFTQQQNRAFFTTGFAARKLNTGNAATKRRLRAQHVSRQTVPERWNHFSMWKINY